MENKIPEKPTPTDATKPPNAIQGDDPQKQPQQPFSEHMQKSAVEKAQQGNSPLDLARQQGHPTSQPTMATIQTQMNSASGSLGDVQNQLHTKNLKLKQSQKYLLRNKLSEANAHVRTAASKAGVQVGNPPTMNTRQSPIRRYLAYVTDSQDQLAQAQRKIKDLTTAGHSLSPGQMLLIQIKLNKASQAIEYSTVLLSKAVDDIKMLFNVQI
ncbi:hypothetical protein COB11_01585 [Candidatus Aerophobetes bacterium]|uniref:Uncharacterized protein n=1 Tax=Aerophobetes bacterium TaxID=2030807 RepID=A0A2A4YLD3_UNCAE|nr:MAG: hypothetical protein COB11_01585 [Candidatus Aerophobetes bacterium]